MAIDFPASPTNGQTYVFNGVTYTYDGTKWTAETGSVSLDKIEEGNTSAEVIDTGSDGRFVVTTEGTPRATVDSAGRLLVGTSSSISNLYRAGTSAVSPTLQIENATNSYNSGYSNINYSASGFAPILTLGLSKSNTQGTNTVVASGDELGYIHFVGADGTNLRTAAWIRGEVDGTPGANDMPGRLVFSTTADGASSPTERMRIGNQGRITTTCVENNYEALILNHNGTSGQQYGLTIRTANDQNDSSRYFINCVGSVTSRFIVRSNGGIANFSANNVNLSDRSTKKDITSAAGTWDCLKQWEIVNFRYIDQPDGSDLNMGVIAQQVAESCPEVVTVFQEATDDQPEKLGVKDQQMMWMGIKALQEAQLRIETLEAANTDLAARITALEAN